MSDLDPWKPVNGWTRWTRWWCSTARIGRRSYWMNFNGARRSGVPSRTRPILRI